MGVLLPENMREKVIQEDPVDMEGMKEDQEGLLPLHLVGMITLLEEVVGFQKGGTGRHHLHIARCYKKNKKLFNFFSNSGKAILVTKSDAYYLAVNSFHLKNYIFMKDQNMMLAVRSKKNVDLN